MAAELDDGDEHLLDTIFRESFPESWRDNPDFAAYLTELSSSSIDSLGQEPERLAEERAQILEQTQDLAFHNYKTFIETAECSKEIFQDFISVEKHVESVLENLPSFSQSCSGFVKAAQEINSNRRLNSIILSRHTQLLEILEIPQLMDTCVRNGYYEEALELSSYVRRLEKKLYNIQVIQNIVSEVQSSSQLMLSQLLQQLRSSIQLPACLRVIGYLRRLDVFSESELRVKFLQARDAWLKSILGSIGQDDPYYHITKTIEASRVHLFDIVTQYRAVFSDDDPILSIEEEESPVYSNLFHCWIVQKVSQFLKTLECDLERGVGSRLDSLLGQCMYFGLSFSRVGADFRGLLPPLFQAAANRGFTNAVDAATSKFKETMKSYTLHPVPSTLKTTIISTTSGKGEDKRLSPPISLLEHPPLATFTNDVLSAFNELRHCAPIALSQVVCDQVQSALCSVVETTYTFHKTEAAALNEKERNLFSNFCRVLTVDLVPYLDHCLETIFPSSALTGVMPSTTSLLSSRRNHGMHVQQIVEPLLPLLPQEASDAQPTNKLPRAAPLPEHTVDSTSGNTTSLQVKPIDANVDEHSVDNIKILEYADDLAGSNRDKKLD